MEYLGISGNEEGDEMEKTPAQIEVDSAVQWMTDNQIMLGNTEGDLMLEQPLTRLQYAVMEYRRAKLEGRV